MSPPYPHAANLYLAVPTAETSDATTPELLTRLVTPVTLPVLPKPKIPLSSPYSHPAGPYLAVPTADTSDATTPTLETKLVTPVALPV